MLIGLPPMSALTTTWRLWLGFTAATMAVNATWDTRPWSVYAINVAYLLVAMSVAAAVVAAWPS